MEMSLFEIHLTLTETAFGKEPKEPIVHTWMPAAAVYFRDRDGNGLEFITRRLDEPKPEMALMYLSEWEAFLNKDTT